LRGLSPAASRGIKSGFWSGAAEVIPARRALPRGWWVCKGACLRAPPPPPFGGPIRRYLSGIGATGYYGGAFSDCLAPTRPYAVL
jgi:hypothetical protein